jgi:hypothetical protein
MIVVNQCISQQSGHSTLENTTNAAAIDKTENKNIQNPQIDRRDTTMADQMRGLIDFDSLKKFSLRRAFPKDLFKQSARYTATCFSAITPTFLLE